MKKLRLPMLAVLTTAALAQGQSEPLKVHPNATVVIENYNTLGCTDLNSTNILATGCVKILGGSQKVSCVDNPGGLCVTMKSFNTNTSGCADPAGFVRPIPCDVCMARGGPNYYKITGCGTSSQTVHFGCKVGCENCEVIKTATSDICVSDSGRGYNFFSPATCETLITHAFYDDEECTGNTVVYYDTSGGCNSIRPTWNRDPYSFKYTCKNVQRAHSVSNNGGSLVFLFFLLCLGLFVL